MRLSPCGVAAPLVGAVTLKRWSMADVAIRNVTTDDNAVAGVCEALRDRTADPFGGAGHEDSACQWHKKDARTVRRPRGRLEFGRLLNLELGCVGKQLHHD